MAIDAVLAGDHEVVVFLSGARVFSNGVDFTLEVRARHAITDGRGHMLGGVHGNGDPNDRLLLGIEFSDGRRCTNVGDALDFDSGDSGERPLLMPRGGSGQPSHQKYPRGAGLLSSTPKFASHSLRCRPNS